MISPDKGALIPQLEQASLVCSGINMLPTDILLQAGFPLPRETLVLHNAALLLGEPDTVGILRQGVSAYLGYLSHEPDRPQVVEVGYYNPETEGGTYYTLGAKDPLTAEFYPHRLGDSDSVIQTWEAYLRQAKSRGEQGSIHFLCYGVERDSLHFLSEVGIFPLGNLTKEQVGGVGRLEGLQLASQAGFELPDGMVVITDPIFKRWLPEREFNDLDRHAIILTVQHSVEKYGRVSVRRAYGIEGIKDDLGKARAFFNQQTSEEEIIAEIELFYRDALTAFRDQARKMALTTKNGKDEETLFRELLEQGKAKACIVLHQFVDPIELNINPETKDIIAEPGTKLPASLIIRPLDKKATQWAVAVGYGNARGPKGRQNIFSIDSTGRVQIPQLGPFHQEMMIGTVGVEEVDGIIIPTDRRSHSPLQPWKEPRAVYSARQMYERAISQRQYPFFQIEFTLGKPVGDNPREPLYVTQIVPCEVGDLTDAFMGEGQCLLLPSDQSLSSIQSLLQTKSSNGLLFIAVPHEVFVKEGFNEVGLIGALAERKDVVLLLGVDYTTGHAVNNIIHARIPVVLVGSFPIGELQGRQIIVEKPPGTAFEIRTELPEKQMVASLESAWQYGIKACCPKVYHLSRIAQTGFDTARAAAVFSPTLMTILNDIKIPHCEGLTTLKTYFNQLIQLGEEVASKMQPDGMMLPLAKRREITETYKQQAMKLAGLISTGLSQAHIPKSIMDEIAVQVSQVFQDKPPAHIVCRSASSAEDLVQQTAAGIFASVGARGKYTMADLNRAMTEVYCSLFSTKAIEYIFQQLPNAPDLLINMAMSIMVSEYKPVEQADLSFYLYTAQPNDPNSAVISISDQPAADIASGVSRNGRGTDVLFNKHTYEILNIRDIRRDLLEKARRIMQVLKEKKLVELLETYFNGPADIEGMFEAKNNLNPIIFQGRPF